MRIIFLVVLLISFLLPAFSQESRLNFEVYKKDKAMYKGITDDPLIMLALDEMVGTRGEFSRKAILGNNVSGKAIKILFRNLTEIDPKYKDFDAIGWKKKGQLHILINNKNKNAPPEALAALLSHEAIHQDDYNSKTEETYAWSLEAAVWSDLVKKNSSLEKIHQDEFPLVNRMVILSKMYTDAGNSSRLIRQKIFSCADYKDLPLYSPGFEKH